MNLLLALILAIALPAHAALFGKSKSSGETGTSPETVTIDHDPFRIVAQGRRISTGTFPNHGGNPFAAMEVTGFSVCYQEKPVVVTHGDRAFEDELAHGRYQERFAAD